VSTVYVWLAQPPLFTEPFKFQVTDTGPVYQPLLHPGAPLHSGNGASPQAADAIPNHAPTTMTSTPSRGRHRTIIAPLGSTIRPASA
jgi:hypothetical protein